MSRSALTALFVTAAMVASGCSGGDDERGLEPLQTPTYAPETTVAGAGQTSTTESGHTGAATTVPVTASGPDVTADVETTTTTAAARAVERVRVDDPDDDAVGGVDPDPPAWTDLAGVELVRQGNAYALRVQLAGGEAPKASDGQSTMNIASFYDVDGDGSVDYEVWANLGPDGWGGSWFDDQGHGSFGEDSNVSIEIDGDAVAILFPDVMLGQAERFRFSVASEYGELSALGSGFTRRDDVPDGDRAVVVPGLSPDAGTGARRPPFDRSSAFGVRLSPCRACRSGCRTCHRSGRCCSRSGRGPGCRR